MIAFEQCQRFFFGLWIPPLVAQRLSGPPRRGSQLILLGLGLIGNPGLGFERLPMLEADFTNLPAGLAPILSFESKTDPDSPYWNDIRVVPADLPEAEQRALAQRCEALFGRLGLRDYGRFDFRTAEDGTVKLLEVNPNPAWGFDAKLALMAGFAGWSYAELLETLVLSAWARVTRAAEDR